MADWGKGLPDTALQNILLKAGHSARHGLKSLALVGPSWAKAVAAVEDKMKEFDVPGCTNIKSFERYLDNPEHREWLKIIFRLTLYSVKGLSRLPCPQLQHLVLRSCDITGGSAVCRTISTLTSMTNLHFNKCRLVLEVPRWHGSSELSESPARQFSSALTHLTALKELSMCGVDVWSIEPPAAAASGAALPAAPSAAGHLLLPPTVLQSLPHLTQLHLQLGNGDETAGVLQHIGTMTDLQDLRLGGLKGPSLGLGLQVTMLTALTKLQRLGLRGVILGHGFRELSPDAAALLAWLPTLQGLSSLQLRAVHGLDTGGRIVLPDNFEPDAAYSALTASSGLQHIDLRDTRLSQNAGRGAFPADRTFSSITSLRFGHPDSADSSEFDFYAAVSACPNLHELQYTGMYDGEVLLQQATALTKLTVRQARQGSCPQLGGLSQLKSLQLLGLSVHRVEDFAADLQQLPSLTQLSFLRLEVHSRGMLPTALGNFRLLCSVFDGLAATAELSEDDKSAFATWTFVSKAAPDSPPDVSSQLQAALGKAEELATEGFLMMD